MKFSIASISAVLMAISTVSGDIIIKRHDATEQNQTLSQYPNTTNIGALNGTWYLTGVTQNVWDLYTSIQKSMNIEVNCLQLNVTKSSNTSFDALASAFLNHSGSEIGVNASAAGEFMLQAPDNSVNTSDSEYLWNAYASQVFVNGAQWSNFTSNGKSNQNATESCSEAVPGTKPFEVTVYSKLIDSNAQPGTNSSTNYDTVFLWGFQIKLFDPSSYQKRAANQVYGVILSKTSHVGQDTFNKTLALLPPQIAQNNISVVLLNDTCHNNTQH